MQWTTALTLFVKSRRRVARFHAPNGLAVGANEVPYVVEYINHVIRQLTPRGEVSTFAGVFKGWASRAGSRAEASFDLPFGLAVGPIGWVCVTDTRGRTIRVIR